MMTTRHKTLTFAALGTLVAAVLAGGAFAADPAPARKGSGPAPKRLTREEFLKQSPDQVRRFQENSERAKLSQNNYTDLLSPRGPSKDMTIRIEEYVDGTILYSEPYDPANEEKILMGGVYRKVETREKISEKTLFQGRIYRVMKVVGDARDWERAEGQEVIVKVQANGYGAAVGVSLRTKR
jgi:hypothetical protein